jgi:hypothetical protein
MCWTEWIERWSKQDKERESSRRTGEAKVIELSKAQPSLFFPFFFRSLPRISPHPPRTTPTGPYSHLQSPTTRPAVPLVPPRSSSFLIILIIVLAMSTDTRLQTMRKNKVEVGANLIETRDVMPLGKEELGLIKILKDKYEFLPGTSCVCLFPLLLCMSDQRFVRRPQYLRRRARSRLRGAPPR